MGVVFGNICVWGFLLVSNFVFCLDVGCFWGWEIGLVGRMGCYVIVNWGFIWGVVVEIVELDVSDVMVIFSGVGV